MCLEVENWQGLGEFPTVSEATHPIFQSFFILKIWSLGGLPIVRVQMGFCSHHTNEGDSWSPQSVDLLFVKSRGQAFQRRKDGSEMGDNGNSSRWERHAAGMLIAGR